MAAAPKILVIDDDKTFTTMAAALLRSAGYRTVVAFDAMQGFMFAGREAPALVLLASACRRGAGCSCSTSYETRRRPRTSR